jgi:hypothetical protein
VERKGHEEPAPAGVSGPVNAGAHACFCRFNAGLLSETSVIGYIEISARQMDTTVLAENAEISPTLGWKQSYVMISPKLEWVSLKPCTPYTSSKRLARDHMRPWVAQHTMTPVQLSRNPPSPRHTSRLGPVTPIHGDLTKRTWTGSQH